MVGICYAITGTAELAVCLVFMAYLRKKTAASWVPFLAGILCYFCAAMVRSVLRMGLSTEDATGYACMHAILNAVLEEGARLLAFRYMLTRYDRREEVVAYGLGGAYAPPIHESLVPLL